MEPPELDTMACAYCDQIAEILQVTPLDDVPDIPMVQWRTRCLEGHVVDNFWGWSLAPAHEDPALETGEPGDVTAP